MEKSGFVYIWYDRKRKMYYIGCHWGHELDGYICSSKRMRDAYNYRPQDFKRRIIQRNIPRETLLEEEFKWLNLIPDRELGKQYYNHSKKHFGHWMNSPKKDEIAKRCANKGTPKTKLLTDNQRSEHGKRIAEAKAKKKAERIALGLPLRAKEKNPRPPKGPQSPESNAKRSEAMKKAWEEGRNTGTTGHTYEWSEERKQNHKQGVQGCHVNRDPTNYSIAGKKAWAEGKFANRKNTKYY